MKLSEAYRKVLQTFRGGQSVNRLQNIEERQIAWDLYALGLIGESGEWCLTEAGRLALQPQDSDHA